MESYFQRLVDSGNISFSRTNVSAKEVPKTKALVSKKQVLSGANDRNFLGTPKVKKTLFCHQSSSCLVLIYCSNTFPVCSVGILDINRRMEQTAPKHRRGYSYEIATPFVAAQVQKP